MKKMNRLKTLVARLVRDEQGQDLIEYALLGALIAVAVTLAMTALATQIGVTFDTIRAKLGG
jgi:pilus assembly protein Flp/PilA